MNNLKRINISLGKWKLNSIHQKSFLKNKLKPSVALNFYFFFFFNQKKSDKILKKKKKNETLLKKQVNLKTWLRKFQNILEIILFIIVY